MKLFVKHITRSIKKSPLQPILIILTLIVATTTFIVATKMAINMQKESGNGKNLDNYICDISVKLSGTDDVRMLFADDAKRVIGDAGEILGEFSLSGIVNMNGVRELEGICAANIKNADEFYNFKFTEYGKITEKNLNDVIIISTYAADKYDLSIGDIFTLNILNRKFDFTVAAVAYDEGVLYNSIGIINIGAISKALADANPSIGALSDGIVPYTSLKIRINDKSEIDEYISLLSSDPAFNDKQIIKEADNVGSADFFHLISISITSVAALIVIMLAAIVIASSLDLLGKKRRNDTALFMICGADASDLNRILYLECLIYSLFAAVVGIFLSLPIMNAVNNIFNWSVEDMSFRIYDIPIALFGSVFILLMTEYIRNRRTKKLTVSELMSDQNRSKIGLPSVKNALVFAALCVTFVIVTFLVPVTHRYISGLAAIISFITFIYLFTPCIIRIISNVLVLIIEKTGKIPAKVLLALKNISASYPLMHAARLVSVLLTILFAVLTCLRSMNEQMTMVESMIDCEYIIQSANEDTDMLVKDMDGVDDAFRFGIINNVVTEENTGMVTISATEDALEHIHPDIAPKRVPVNDEIVISSGIATLCKKDVGEQLVLKYETKEYSFRIIEVIDAVANLAFIDGEYMGIKNELLCVRSDISMNSEAFGNIANVLEARGAGIVKSDDVLGFITIRLHSYYELLTYIVAIAAITTLLGICNVLLSSHLSRTRERDIYYMVGMTKKDIAFSCIIEIALVFVTAIILVPIFGALVNRLMDISLISFGIDLL